MPIHSVVLTALTKFDGTKMRRLRAREFHQIAGRAGRMGFDTEGLVIAEAPEYEIENQKAIAKAGGDPKKLKKVKRKKAPEGFVTWNQSTFDKLIDAEPETLVPHLKITHSMVLNEVAQGGDAVPVSTISSTIPRRPPTRRSICTSGPTRSSKPCSIPKSSKPRTARTAARTTT